MSLWVRPMSAMVAITSSLEVIGPGFPLISPRSCAASYSSARRRADDGRLI
jgi:hypothetical protein